MFKLFSLQEANELIPLVEEHLETMQSAVQATLRLRDEISRLKPFSIEARNKAQEIAFLMHEVHETKAQLDRLGVFLTDIDVGVVDFPSQVGAEVVYLSWEKGQDAITHYHRLNEAGRQPLPQRPEPLGALA